MVKHRTLPRITTDRLVIRLLDPDDAPLMVRFRRENRDHLTPWEPRRPPGFFTEPFWQLQLQTVVREFHAGASICLTILDARETEVLGVCNYTNIVRGTFQSCHLGYALAKRSEGDGIMFEALQHSIDYVFEEFDLHRIMANYLPWNQRSADLLSRMGFTIEGQAQSFLKINGKWEDHVLTSLVNPNDCAHSAS